VVLWTFVMTQPPPSPTKSAPRDTATYVWVALGLIGGATCLLLAFNPSPLRDWLHRLNFHIFGIPWSTFDTLLMLFLLLTPCIALLGTGIGFWRSRRIATMRTARILIDVSFLFILMAGCLWFLESSTLDGGYSWRFRERYDALSAEKEIWSLADSYAANHDGRRPPHLAALVEQGLSPRLLRYHNSKTPPLPESVLSVEPERWSTIAAAVDSHCDFAYLGGDLTISPSLQPESSRIVVLYGKIDLPEIPQVIYDADHHVYEYPFAARPVAFADGHARFVPLEELPQLVVEHNAARARLGLPPQKISP
jgi:hypothetical protein